MKEKSYYSITTRKFTLRCRHPEWLKTTQDFYNRIVLFYYDLYLDQWESGQREGLSGQQALRRLERLSIVGRDRQPVPYPLPWERVPLYFRRSAANKGIAAGRSYLARSLQISDEENNKATGLQNTAEYRLEKRHKIPRESVETQRSVIASENKRSEEHSLQLNRSRFFQEPVTYYKGMYRELTDRSVELKVWNGQEWCYLHCRLSSNTIPEGATCLSPSVFLRGKVVYCNIPVRTAVQDGRKTKERLQQGTNICTIQFASGNIFAVCLVTDCNGKQLGVQFICDADRYVQLCRNELNKIEKSKRERTAEGKGHRLEGLDERSVLENKRYWIKLKNINNYFSNKVSRQVINYSKFYGAGIIVMPEYEKVYAKYVMQKSGNWSSVHLSTRIREQIYYKAWQEGILVLEAKPYDCGKICAVCGAAVRREGKECLCENGHRGNRYLNSACNLNRVFRESIFQGKYS